MNKKVSKFIRSLNSCTKEIVIEVLESPTKWNLIQFYKANPFSIHTPRGLANIIGRGADQVFKDAEDLANAGILKKISENGDPSSIYSYEPNEAVAPAIEMLLELGNDPRTPKDELLLLIKNNGKGDA